MKPMCRRANPDEETTDWRAVCGKTASTVRRAGRARALPTPIQSDPLNVGFRIFQLDCLLGVYSGYVFMSDPT